MQVILSPEAAADIASIRAFIDARSPHAARRVVMRLLTLCEDLERLPERGRPGRLSGTRELASVWPYVIVYQIVGTKVRIARIYHGRQDR